MTKKAEDLLREQAKKIERLNETIKELRKGSDYWKEQSAWWMNNSAWWRGIAGEPLPEKKTNEPGHVIQFYSNQITIKP